MTEFWVDDEFIGGGAGHAERDDAHWCLVDKVASGQIGHRPAQRVACEDELLASLQAQSIQERFHFEILFEETAMHLSGIFEWHALNTNVAANVFDIVGASKCDDDESLVFESNTNGVFVLKTFCCEKVSVELHRWVDVSIRHRAHSRQCQRQSHL